MFFAGSFPMESSALRAVRRKIPRGNKGALKLVSFWFLPYPLLKLNNRETIDNKEALMPVKHIPEGYHAVTPLLSVKEAARLIDFLKAAFDAVELYRFPAEDGSVMHATIRIRDSLLMLGEAMEGFPVMPASIYLYVPDADATYKAAMDAGGESLEGPADQFWGDRVATIRDFAGNKWWIATHVEDVNSEELARRAQARAA
jgi:PhnB protein